MTSYEPLVSEHPAIASYMARLALGLAALPEAERRDALAEIEAHVMDALAAGQSPDALLAGLGEAEVVAAGLVGARLGAVEQSRSAGDLRRMVASALAAPFALTFVAIAALFLIDAGLRAGAGMLGALPLHLAVAWLIAMPYALLLTGLVGLPRLARRLSAPGFERLRGRLIVVFLMLGVLASVTGLIVQDRFVVPALRLETARAAGVAPDYASGPWSGPRALTLDEIAARQVQVGAALSAARQGDAPMDTQLALSGELFALRVEHQARLADPALSFGAAMLGLVGGILLARAVRRARFAIIGIGLVGFLVLVVARWVMNSLQVNAASGFVPPFAMWLPLAGVLATAGAVAFVGRLAGLGEPFARHEASDA